MKMAQITLRATEGDLKGEAFVFTSPAHCLIGRTHDCTLRLPGQDRTASRRHCLLEVGARGRVQDLGSLNGTYINGRPIGGREGTGEDVTVAARPAACLATGDRLQVGQTVFVVEVAEVAAGQDEPHRCEERAALQPLC